ncbi:MULTISPECIES: GGDEF domain-containing protein [Protofrankia]|uniref:GGDEF domain-containing protein n=1 Tax=Protofrankia TaxID=2994361 RepID=UPI0001C52FB4|nr:MULTISPECIES: GGDEF domain-containing protein [Protofrankia]
MIAYQNAQLFEEVQRHAATDQLTGLANRRHFLEQAERAVKSHAATDLPLSAAMMDIDYFKRVNDAYGHSVGDEVLAEIARRIRSSLRGEEILGRIGGEEFAVLMSVPASTATALAERLRAAVAHRPVNTSIGPLDIRLSIGLAHLAPHDTDLRDLLDRADQALYTAKRGGRDQVAVHH